MVVKLANPFMATETRSHIRTFSSCQFHNRGISFRPRWNVAFGGDVGNNQTLRAAPPGIPEAILTPLQRAFGAAFADPLYQEMARKDKLPVQYSRPAQVQKMLTDSLMQPPEVSSYFKTMVMPE